MHKHKNSIVPFVCNEWHISYTMFKISYKELHILGFELEFSNVVLMKKKKKLQIQVALYRLKFLIMLNV